MGQRRMYAKEIVRSDAFLDLPLSAQCLYFQLGMDTDDRGYISNGKSIIRLIGANQGDLEILIQKRFILVRDNYLLLQKHFKSNNYIRPDRFHETNYTEDLALLFYDENGNYTESKTDKNVLGYQVVGKCPTEVKLSKDKLSKDKLKIELDITRYKQLALLEQLVYCEYLTKEDIQDLSYDELLDDFVQKYGYVDTKIKINYFCNTYNVRNEEIDSKYCYLKKSLEKSFARFAREE